MPIHMQRVGTVSQTTRIAIAVMGSLVLSLRCGAEAMGQISGPARLDLAEVIREALERNPALVAARIDLEAAEAGVRVAAGPFDPEVAIHVREGRDSHSGTMDGEAAGAARQVGIERSVGAELTTRLRNGVVVSPYVALTQSRVLDAGWIARERGAVGLALQVPLAQAAGLRATPAAAAEQVASRNFLAVTHAYRHLKATVALEAVESYWDQVAAFEGARIMAEAEERARLMLQESHRLVELDERPASELLQLQANLAHRTGARIRADQQFSGQRVRLGLLMGRTADEIAHLPVPPSGLPEVPIAGLHHPESAELVATAVRLRSDLAARRAAVSAAEIELVAISSEVRPAIDLGVLVAYSEPLAGPSSVAIAARAGRGGSTGLKIELRLRGGLTHAAAAGRLAIGRANQQRPASRLAELEREIEVAVALAIAALANARLEHEQASLAAATAEIVLGNEHKKFQLGMATLFDVLHAADRVTAERLNRVDSWRRHVLAAARLEFETGMLLASVEQDLDTGPDEPHGQAVHP